MAEAEVKQSPLGGCYGRPQDANGETKRYCGLPTVATIRTGKMRHPDWRACRKNAEDVESSPSETLVEWDEGSST